MNQMPYLKKSFHAIQTEPADFFVAAAVCDTTGAK